MEERRLASRNGLQIRAASNADIGGIADLLTAAGHRVSAATLTTRLEAVRHGAGVVLMAIEWGPPSGLVALNWFATLSDDLPSAQISLLVVDPDDRRRGIGRLLLKAAAQAARIAGCGTMSVSAPDDASGLREFCGATGFEIAGARYARSLRRRS